MIPYSLKRSRVRTWDPVTEELVLQILQGLPEQEAEASNHQGVNVRHLEELFKKQWSALEKVVDSLIRKNLIIAIEWDYGKDTHGWRRRAKDAYFLRRYPDHACNVRNGAVLYLPDRLPRNAARFVEKAPNKKIRAALIAKRTQLKESAERNREERKRRRTAA